MVMSSQGASLPLPNGTASLVPPSITFLPFYRQPSVLIICLTVLARLNFEGFVLYPTMRKKVKNTFWAQSLCRNSDRMLSKHWNPKEVFYDEKLNPRTPNQKLIFLLITVIYVGLPFPFILFYK
jgi:hypothetical protein